MNSSDNKSMQKISTIVIGCSSGGFSALKQMVSGLSQKFIPPIVVVQHMKADMADYFIQALDTLCSFCVKFADEKEKILNQHIYVAPPDYHLLIETDLTFSLSTDPKVNFARPSFDVLFETAALACQDRLLGIVLTGANSDGSSGLVKIKSYGGVTMAQNPLTAENSMMPQKAISTGKVDHILDLEKIIEFLNHISQKRDQ